jgi:hypothetical protein
MAFQQGQAFTGQFGFTDPASEWAARAAYWAQQQHSGLSANQLRTSNVLQTTPIRPLMDITPSGYAVTPSHPGQPYPTNSNLSVETMPFQRVDDFHGQHAFPMNSVTAPGQFVAQPAGMQLESGSVPLHAHSALTGQLEGPPRFAGPPGDHREPWNVQPGVSTLTPSLQQHLPVAPMMSSKPVPLFQVGTALASEPAKKRLPAWIRDGLAKAGRDLQKKLHGEMEEQQLTLSHQQNDRQEQHSIEMGNDDVPGGLRRISGYEQSVSRTPSPPTDEEENDVEEQKAEDSDVDTEAEVVRRKYITFSHPPLYCFLFPRSTGYVTY